MNKKMKDLTKKEECLKLYKQVKDNRSNIAYSQADAVLDGDIKKIIESVLISQKSQN